MGEHYFRNWHTEIINIANFINVTLMNPVHRFPYEIMQHHNFGAEERDVHSAI